MFTTNEEPIAALIDLSARLGNDPLLVQANTGNTSVKLDGVLWIKASGKCLADAKCDEILVPVPLREIARHIREGNDLFPPYPGRSGRLFQSSVETAMHGILPHRVVIHVHSINTIAWAVRSDGPFQLKRRLTGLNWCWVPYVASGLPLALEIEKQLFHSPAANVFVLANHGLVVCADNCGSCEALLAEVEKRLKITPRIAPEPDYPFLADIAAHSHWRIPIDETLHALGTDPVCRKLHSGGVLYPCQAMFLESEKNTVRWKRESRDLQQQDRNDEALPFLIIERYGVLVSRAISRTEQVMLNAYVQILRRLADSAPIRYLSQYEIEAAMHFGSKRYKALAHANQAGTALSA